MTTKVRLVGPTPFLQEIRSSGVVLFFKKRSPDLLTSCEAGRISLGTVTSSLFLLLACAWLLCPVRFVLARAEASGRIVAVFPASRGDEFSLTYLHSVYRQPAAEDFVVEAAGFSLARIASPSEAVLEYYGRHEPIVRTETGYEVRPAARRRVHVESLRVLASVEGARTLVMGMDRAPLFATSSPGLPRPTPGAAESSGQAVIISVVRLPRVARWLHR